MTFPLKSTTHKWSNNVDEVMRRSEFSQMNDGAMNKRPTFDDTDTVILSNSMDGNKLLKKTFYRFVRFFYFSFDSCLNDVIFEHKT